MIRQRWNKSEPDPPAGAAAPVLRGQRVTLRPLGVADWKAWQEVRKRNAEWLLKWEPRRPTGHPDPVESRDAFQVRCNARDRERQLSTAYGFGVFVDNQLAGEMNLSGVQRGAFQSCHVGYWIDEQLAGRGYTPEALITIMRFAFEELRLHRVQINIIPRNAASRRVVEKLEVRAEGIAERYLEINGVWEDHVRYAITSEEWLDRRATLVNDWLG